MLLSDEGGQVMPWVVLMMLAILGVAVLVVDVGHAMVIQRELQASTDAAALAAAENISGTSTTFETYGSNYTAASGKENAYPGLTLTGSPTITPLCLATVTRWGISCTVSGTTVTIPNAVSVTQTASLTTLFAGILGKPTMNLSATSTAARARPMPYNIALIVDSTLSMSDTDSNCNNLTQEQCALNGVQQLLGGISTSYDHVALFTFPNVVAGGNAPAGVGITNSGASQAFGCTSTVPSSQNGVAYWNLGSGIYAPIIKPTNTNGTDNNSSDASSTIRYQKSYQPPYTGAAWALPYSFPPIPSDTTGYAIPAGNYPPTYQITTFLEDYNTSSGSLNTSSNLVKAAGGVSGCGGLAPSSYDGDFGTYYPGALYAAQAALLKEQTTHANSTNVMIILGDGNATSPEYWPSSSGPMFSMPATTTEATTTYGTATALNTSAFTFPTTTYHTASSSGSYPSWVGECGQEVDAAQYAATYAAGGVSNPTLVFTIAYGSPASSNSTDCGSDVGAGSHPNITPCESLQKMATQVNGYTISPYFYSDYTAQGGDSGCQANTANSGITAISDIYNAIAARLASTRLIPNGTT